MNEEAIEFVMQFYSITREVALQLYKDEIEAYMSLMTKFNEGKMMKTIKMTQQSETQYELDYQELIAKVSIVDKDAAEYMQTEMRECFSFSPSGDLLQVITWEHTKQGTNYWRDIALKIGQY